MLVMIRMYMGGLVLPSAHHTGSFHSSEEHRTFESNRPSKLPSTRRSFSKASSPLTLTFFPMVVSGDSSCHAQTEATPPTSDTT